MKKIILIFLVLFASDMFAQKAVGPVYDDFIPRTLFAGTVMSARIDTAGMTYSDTTRLFNTRGYAAVYIGIEFGLTNDSGKIVVSYRATKNGTNYDGAGWILLDSLTNSTAGTIRYFALPANALGAYMTQVRVWQSTIANVSSASYPVTVTTRIIRNRYNQEHD